MRSDRRRSLLGLAGVAAIGVAVVQGVGWWSRSRANTIDSTRVRPGDIQMLGSVTCVYCAQARAWFERNGVPYDECLIERDAACARAYDTLRAPGTPVLFVRGRRLLGFDPRAVADALRETEPPTRLQ